MYLRAKIVHKQLKKQPIFIALKIGEFLRRNYKTSIAENSKGEVQKNLQ